ncbi:uncharacterized protein BXZ73DRAFT_82463 [Epithele typhae]|uniref:uncharacterized protein n=1 Tax=Epithele typhae TaxID=378194 RepID=UPI002007D3AC|nr:uncharacterized protein BXZ73DRAFT_82463 [Epithele typhae]KAH9912113.1 hypothetical protein BXZ73DRAFT_82463 [Epithele typhae]
MSSIREVLEVHPFEELWQRFVPGNDPSDDITNNFYYPPLHDVIEEWEVNVEIAKIARSVFQTEALTRGSLSPRMVAFDTSTMSRADRNGRTHRPSLSVYFSTPRTRKLLAIYAEGKDVREEQVGEEEEDIGMNYERGVGGEARGEGDGQSEDCGEDDCGGHDAEDSEVARAPKGYAGRTSYADIVIPLEVKINAGDTASGDSPAQCGIERGSLYEITQSYAEMLGRQHRTFLLAVYILCNEARLVVVDRRAFLISTPFLWGTRQNPMLHHFFWRVAHMSKETLGFDPSVVPATSEDEKRLLAYAKALPTADPRHALLRHLLSRNSKTSEVNAQWPLHRMTMGGETYLVGRPIIQTSMLLGPAPRVYHAFRIDNFDASGSIKDYWRPDVDSVDCEHSVYERLHVKNVPHIPTCVGGEDVRDTPGGIPQRTIKSSQEHVVPYIHYRLLLQEIVQPLLDFENFSELSGFMADAMTAHQRAWEDVKVLHRQISPTSILILSRLTNGVVTRVALLGNWELGKTPEQINDATRPRLYAMAPSWFFRSALSLKYPRHRPYKLSDDIESFIHVLYYIVVRFHKTDLTYGSSSFDYLRNKVEAVFGQFGYIADDEVYNGGLDKLGNFRRRTSWVIVHANKTLDKMLNEVAEIGYKHYARISLDNYDAIYGGRAGTPDSSSSSSSSQSSLDPPTTATSTYLKDVAETGSLETHENLKEVFVRYGDIKNWKVGDALAKKKTKDFFEAARIA